MEMKRKEEEGQDSEIGEWREKINVKLNGVKLWTIFG